MGVTEPACWVLLATLATPSGGSEFYRAPRAGEAFTATAFGHSRDVPARDRTTLNVLDLGTLFIPDGPEGKRDNAFAGVFLWRNRDEGRQRFRAVLSGVYNTIRYDVLPWHRAPLELVATFDNYTLPHDRSDYVEGERIRSEDLRWYTARAGFGLGYRSALAPYHQDNHIEAALTYEPGYLYFERGNHTDPSYLVPTSTYEGRVRLRLRVDTMERNVIELPINGVSAGLDAQHARRSEWNDWGGPILGFESGSKGEEWNSLAVYAVVATPAFVRSERHRFVASFYGGTGTDTDRFSAFRLGGGPTAGDWEALARPILPAAGFEEIVSRFYGIAALEYRYDVLVFTSLRFRATFAEVDRLRFDDAGNVVARIDPMKALSIGITTGFAWRSRLELAYTYNFDIVRQRGGVSVPGDGAILLHWAKSF